MANRDLQFDGIRETARVIEQALLVDDTLDASFPASDPPSWTASVARPAPAVVTRAD